MPTPHSIFAARLRTTNAMRGLRLTVIPTALTAAMWSFRSNDVSIFAIGCSFVLAMFAVAAYFRWRDGITASATPVFAMVVAMFWVAYVPPLFWGRETLIGFNGERNIPAFAMDLAMAAGVLGVSAMWAGYSLRIARRTKPRELLLFRSTPSSHVYLWGLALAGLIALRVIEPFILAASAFRQPLSIVVQFTPTVAFAILVLEYFRGRTTYLDRIGIVLYAVLRLAVGLASGWLGSAIATGLVLVLGYAMQRRRLPVSAVAATLLLILFLQPGKENFRGRFWYGGETGTVTERIYEWGAESTRLWKDALLGQSGAEWRDLSMNTVSRFDIVHQSANVIDYTPAVVPYQQGRLYSYLLVTYIPRFVWPNKPSMSDANRWYQVAYGLTDQENLDLVSIACGFLTEAYINFGWLGIPLIMFGVGVFLDYVERALLSRSAGIYFNALGLALVPQLLTIEAQLGQYIAGILQMIALTTVVLLPVLIWRRKAEQRAIAATRIVGFQRAGVASAATSEPLSPA